MLAARRSKADFGRRRGRHVWKRMTVHRQWVSVSEWTVNVTTSFEV